MNIIKKKILAFLALLGLIVLIPQINSAEASNINNHNELSNSINLEDINLSNLDSGEQITIGDLTIKQYSNEEAAKKIAEETNKNEYEILKSLNKSDNNVKASRSSLAKSTCSTGAVAFSRKINTNKPYKPTFNIWTKMCQNNAGQYVIRNVVDMSLNRKDGITVKGFNGSTSASALNNGKTLFYRVEGSFYNNSESTLGPVIGLHTPVASISYYATSTSSYYAYAHQTDNIILFR